MGRPPVLRRMSKRREISSIVALVAPRGGRPARLYARHYSRSIHAEEVLDALRYFRRRIGVPLIVVWDRLSAHRARAVQDFLAAHPEDLYASVVHPELGHQAGKDGHRPGLTRPDAFTIIEAIHLDPVCNRGGACGAHAACAGSRPSRGHAVLPCRRLPFHPDRPFIERAGGSKNDWQADARRGTVLG